MREVAKWKCGDGDEGGREGEGRNPEGVGHLGPIFSNHTVKEMSATKQIMAAVFG